ncbi:hypothetical protein E2C01_074225 [Portunus trituberculatus]|uniref:Uncharacterized protein n=1 Tax=Portunus trituberculatus TaxID=210409 RepID=A0A5B7IGJ2_PORTR|nr:hypothetical protein [Portunus trituberculatus]
MMREGGWGGAGGVEKEDEEEKEEEEEGAHKPCSKHLLSRLASRVSLPDKLILLQSHISVPYRCPDYHESL